MPQDNKMLSVAKLVLDIYQNAYQFILVPVDNIKTLYLLFVSKKQSTN
jgi:hypothetical protein